MAKKILFIVALFFILALVPSDTDARGGFFLMFDDITNTYSPFPGLCWSPDRNGDGNGNNGRSQGSNDGNGDGVGNNGKADFCGGARGH